MWAWGSSPAVADVGLGPAVWCSSLAGVLCHVLVWFEALNASDSMRTQTLIYTALVCVKFTMGIEPPG